MDESLSVAAEPVHPFNGLLGGGWTLLTSAECLAECVLQGMGFDTHRL